MLPIHKIPSLKVEENSYIDVSLTYDFYSRRNSICSPHALQSTHMDWGPTSWIEYSYTPWPATIWCK